MSKLDPAVRKETGYIAAWVLALSLVMEAVFVLTGQWNWKVLAGNIAGAAIAIGNFFLMAVIVSRALEGGKADEATRKIHASYAVRLIVMAGLCALVIGVAKTNVYATVIPLLFPRIALAFRPMIDKKNGKTAPDTEGSEPLD